MSLITYVVAFFSDVLDGYLARRNNWITNLGKVLDPLADKLMLFTVLVCFFYESWIPLWIPIFVAIKELLMIVVGAMLFSRKIVVYADIFGKLATGVFGAGIVLTMLGHHFTWLIESGFCVTVLTAGVALSLIAMFHYAKSFGLFGGKNKS